MFHKKCREMKERDIKSTQMLLKLTLLLNRSKWLTLKNRKRAEKQLRNSIFDLTKAQKHIMLRCRVRDLTKFTFIPMSSLMTVVTLLWYRNLNWLLSLSIAIIYVRIPMPAKESKKKYRIEEKQQSENSSFMLINFLTTIHLYWRSSTLGVSIGSYMIEWKKQSRGRRRKRCEEENAQPKSALALVDVQHYSLFSSNQSQILISMYDMLWLVAHCSLTTSSQWWSLQVILHFR